jgi:UMF1 family MFS transporter
VAQGEWLLALSIYALAGIGFSGANIFYDALLIDIADTDNFDSVSAFGYSLGYLGGGLALVVAIVFTTFPAVFGFANISEAMLASFVLVGLWWAVFSIPLFRGTPKAHSHSSIGMSKAIHSGFGQLIDTFKEVRQLKVVLLFLIAYWFYIDGVATMIRMSMNYGVRMGFDQMSLVQALLVTQFVGFPAAIIYGKLGEKYGAKLGIYFAIVVYMLVTGYAYFMDQVSEFYTLAIIIGLVQGGIQSLSRSFYARLIPRSKAAEFFGFFNMMGKFAAILGPLLMAAVSSASADPRLSILAILVLFAIGGGLLFMVDEKKASV